MRERLRDLLARSPFEPALGRLRSALRLEPKGSARYDAETRAVMERVLGPASNCIDVGCHRGVLLREMLRIAPAGTHYAFEPLPEFHRRLASNLPSNVRLFDIALSDHSGIGRFNRVRSRPATSGFRSRTDVPSPDLIEVKVARLDDVVPPETDIAFIKIDVEGAEHLVLRGAAATLVRCRPYVVFEHGIGGADLYGSTTGEIFGMLRDAGLQVSTMADWLAGRPPLSAADFAAHFIEGRNYYFLAHPPRDE